MSILKGSPRVKLSHLAVATVGLVVMLGASLVFAPQDAEAQGGAYACIESDVVQNSTHGEGMSVGNIIVSDEYGSYTVTKGGPTCTLEASDCDPSLNLYVVADVKTCLADIAEADAAPDADAATDSASHGATLAHTGEEHVLGATFAIALIGAGSAALGMARGGRRRRNL